MICDVSSLEPTEWVWSVQRNFLLVCLHCLSTVDLGISRLSLSCVGERVEAYLWRLWVGGEPRKTAGPTL